MEELAQWTVIAQVVRPQGRKGEVLAELLTDFPERFADRKSLVLLRKGQPPAPVVLENYWLPTGKSAGRVVLHFAGVDSISAAELLSGAEIAIADSDRVPLEEGSYYVSDLIGCTVTEEEHTLGIVRDVHFPADTHGKRLTEAAPILVVERPDGDELLIPMVKDFLHTPSISEKRIEVRLPPGLLEING